MFGRMTIGKKVLAGFGILFLITIILGLTAVVKMSEAKTKAEVMSTEQVPEVVLATSALYPVGELGEQSQEFALLHDEQQYQQCVKSLEHLKNRLVELKSHADRSVTLTKLKAEVPKFQAAVSAWESLLGDTKSASAKFLENRTKLTETEESAYEDITSLMKATEEKLKRRQDLTADSVLAELQQEVNAIDDLRDSFNSGRLQCWISIAQRQLDGFEKAGQMLDANLKSVDELAAREHDQELLAKLNSIRRDITRSQEAVRDLSTAWKKMDAVNEARDVEEHKLAEIAHEVADDGTDGVKREAEVTHASLLSGFITVIIGLISAGLVGALMGFFITRSITVSTGRVAEVIASGADQVASASKQVASASQQMAEGASEQASSIEETSSSLEEMSSMTRQNSENASQAQALAEKSRNAATEGDKVMADMNRAMNEIKSASDEVGKIIKTIDEIAFQTNLLALNAAVEAARAGEAGKGFAVVAEEVRNLAQRSAAAAKESATKIEAAIQRSNVGVETAKRVADTLAEISSNVKKANDLVSEIAAASKEQAQGIGQVNLAVQQMDKVVQSNAANAEESASASEEMSAQAETLREAVQELARMVGISTGNGHKAQLSGKHLRHIQMENRYSAKAHPSGNGHTSSDKHLAVKNPAMDRSSKSAEALIPMGDHDDGSEGQFRRF